MDAGVIAMIATGIIAILAAVGVWTKVKNKLSAVKETFEALYVAVEAVLDGQVTKDEAERIKTEVKQAVDAWKS